MCIPRQRSCPAAPTALVICTSANAIWKYGHAFVSQINMLSHPLPEAMLRSLRIKYLRKGDILLS